MADSWNRGTQLSLILSHSNKTWHRTGKNMPVFSQDVCSFILFFYEPCTVFLAPRDLSPNMVLKDPYCSRRTKQGVKLPNFCRTHKHPECRSRSLPDVLCVSCSNKAAATSSPTPGKQHSPQKSSHLETHFH